jgi:hypothetical protein
MTTFTWETARKKQPKNAKLVGRNKMNMPSKVIKDPPKLGRFVNGD